MLKVKIVVANPAEVDNISDFYNKSFLELPRYDVYGFITSNDKFTSENSVPRIVSEFEKNLEMIGVVYSDKLLIKNGKIIEQIYPPYSLTSKSIYNPSIFVNGHIDVPIFDENLSYLASFDAIRKIGIACRVVHIPEFLITSQFVSHNIEKELEYYVRKSS